MCLSVLMLSRLVRRRWFSVPIWLSVSFSKFFFPVPQRNSLPEHAPIPGSSSEAVLVSSTLGLDGVLLAMDGVDERHCTHRSDRVGVGPCIKKYMGGWGGGGVGVVYKQERRKQAKQTAVPVTTQRNGVGCQRPRQSQTQYRTGGAKGWEMETQTEQG